MSAPPATRNDLPTTRRAFDDVEFVAFDTETTGLWWGERLVELAAVRFRGDAVLDRWSTLVDPERPIPEAVTAIHGINDAMVAGAPRAPDALRAFARFCAGALLLAHNADFDRDILAAELARAAMPSPPEALYCTLALARRELPEAPRHGLAKLSAHLGIEGEATHRAAQDAERTRRVFLACAARMAPDADPRALGEARRFDDGARSLRRGPRTLRRALRARARGERVRLVTRDGRAHEGVVSAVYARGAEAAVDLRDGAAVFTTPWSRVASLRRVR